MTERQIVLLNKMIDACINCGGDAEKRYIKRKKLFASMRFPYNTHYVYVRCKVCGATSSVHVTVENATDAWNRRISNV